MGDRPPALSRRIDGNARPHRGRNMARHFPETPARYRRDVDRERLMLTFQLIGAAFLLLCVAPLLAREPRASRASR
jgi:hypothetical protein